MTTYSLTLDDLDLALLPVRSRAYNNFLQKEYFEFQVIVKEEKVEDPSVSVNYKCHICAIDVPAAFMAEHTASMKHRANVRIATEASQRMQALLTACPPPLTPRPAAKFCESCAIITDTDHEKTKEHKVAVMYDRILGDFVNLYASDDFNTNEILNRNNLGVQDDKHKKTFDKDEINRNNLGVQDDKHKKTFDKDEINRNNLGVQDDKHKKTFDKDEINRNNLGVQDDKHKKTVDKDENKVENHVAQPVAPGTNHAKKVLKGDDDKLNRQGNTPSETDREIPEYVKINTETYIQLLNNVTSRQKVTLMPAGENALQIILKNTRINVSSDQFHSFYRKESQIQCNVCCNTFEFAEEEIHKLTVLHMERIMQIVDNHCVRKIYENFSHCILCNQIIKSNHVDAHKLLKRHSERRRNATVAPLAITGNSEQETNEDDHTSAEFFTKVTRALKVSSTENKNINVPFKSSPLNQNSSHNTPIKNVGVKNINTPANQITPQNKAVKNVEVETKYITLPNASTLLSAKKNSEAKTKKKLPKPTTVEIVSEINPRFVEEFLIEYPYESVDTSSVRCVICECVVPSYASNREDHLKGQRHATNLKKHFPALL